MTKAINDQRATAEELAAERNNFFFLEINTFWAVAHALASETLTHNRPAAITTDTENLLRAIYKEARDQVCKKKPWRAAAFALMNIGTSPESPAYLGDKLVYDRAKESIDAYLDGVAKRRNAHVLKQNLQSPQQ